MEKQQLPTLGSFLYVIHTRVCVRAHTCLTCIYLFYAAAAHPSCLAAMGIVEVKEFWIGINVRAEEDTHMLNTVYPHLLYDCPFNILTIALKLFLQFCFTFQGMITC